MTRAVVVVAAALAIGGALGAVVLRRTDTPTISGRPSDRSLRMAHGLTASDVYAFAGEGDRQARDGRWASETQLHSTPWQFAVRRDGLVALTTDHKLFWVRSGRLRGAGVNTRWASDLAFAPDGSLILATCGATPRQPSAVYRITPDTRTQVMRHGLPEPIARLTCPSGIDVQADGSILVADRVANRVRRIAPDGTIQTVAGTGKPARTGDGGLARSAGLLGPSDVTSIPGVGYAIVERDPADSRRGGVRIVNRDGVISTLSRTVPAALAAESDGSLLIAGWPKNDGVVRRRTPDGGLENVARIPARTEGLSGAIAIRNDPAEFTASKPSPFAVMPDGGLLLQAGLAYWYYAPRRSALLALAIRPQTRQARADLRVSVRATQAAHIRVEVRAAGRRVAEERYAVSSGETNLKLHETLRDGLYELRVHAARPGQESTARADVLVGQALPVSYARTVVEDRRDLLPMTAARAPGSRLDCRRVDADHVDCRVLEHQRCVAVATVARNPDGALALDESAQGSRPTCP